MLAMVADRFRMIFLLPASIRMAILPFPLYSFLQLLSKVDISRSGKLGIVIGIWIGASVSLYFLFLGVEALVCVIASNVDGSDLLS